MHTEKMLIKQTMLFMKTMSAVSQLYAHKKIMKISLFCDLTPIGDTNK